MRGTRYNVNSVKPTATENHPGAMEAAFNDVVGVATGWVFDFTFVSMCYYFKEERAEDFQRTCKAIEVLLEGMPVLDPDRRKAVFIAQFLTRVAEGKRLDAQFELDEWLTPLESAVSVLEQIKEKEEPLVNLLNDIKRSVKVQAVAVCMEKGRFKQSAEILDRQFPETESDKYLKMKMAMIINKRDAYHEFLQHFSYKKMLAKIKSYIDLTLKERPSPFLIKVASKVIEAKADGLVATKSMEVDDGFIMNERLTEDGLSFSTEDTIASNPKIQPEEITAENSSSEIEQVDTSDTNDHNFNLIKPVNDQKEVTRDKGTGRLQKRLLSLESLTPWYPGKSCDLKKQMHPMKQGERSKAFEKSVKANLPLHASGKRRQPWIWEEDALLRKGVKKYGVGNWSKILVNFEFNNRTGVMLKDRWRTMRKLNIVGSEDET